ncbi:MAG: hypothetical protein H0S85_03705 [Desulfovibrionaceae bacterium]|jgi:hypothetical protein|nr:hypothetical protein [Desulfovibrionaceae bacterium]
MSDHSGQFDQSCSPGSSSSPSSPGRVARLADLLAQRLARPLTVPAQALEFAASAFGTDSADDLRALLADPDGADGRIFLEYLLFPDETCKAELEPALLAARCTPADAQELARELSRRAVRVTVLPDAPGGGSMPDGAEPEGPPLAELELDAGAAQRWVQRLRPEHTPPPPLLAAVDEAFTGESGRAETPSAPGAGLRLKVLLRHARLEFTDAHCDFLARLLRARAVGTAAGERDSGFAGLLDYACRFLETLAPGADGLAALRARHASARDALKGHARFQEQFAHSNFEIMRLGGGMPAHVDPEELRLEVRRIARLCLAVYGEPALAPGTPVERDLGEFTGEDGARDLLDLLGPR